MCSQLEYQVHSELLRRELCSTVIPRYTVKDVKYVFAANIRIRIH